MNGSKRLGALNLIGLAFFWAAHYVANGAQPNERPQGYIKAGSSISDGSESGMITDAQIEAAAVEFNPLIFYKVISKEELYIGTRSGQTKYQIEIISSAGPKKFLETNLWRWGIGWPSEGFNIAITSGGRISELEIFSADSEIEAKGRFDKLAALMNGHLSNFMEHDAYVRVKRGKGEIVLFKVLATTGNSKGKTNIEIMKNLSGETGGAMMVTVLGNESLVSGSLYFGLLQKSIMGRKISRLRKTSDSEEASLSRLYKMRLDFFKNSWGEVYAEP